MRTSALCSNFFQSSGTIIRKLNYVTCVYSGNGLAHGQQKKMTMTERETKRPSPVVARKNNALVSKAVAGKLKAYYDEIASQDVPDRFIELLDKLDSQEK